MVISTCFLPGDDADESKANFFEWLERVASDMNIQCNKQPKGCRNEPLEGVYHHLAKGVANDLIFNVTCCLERWQSRCTEQNITAGSVLLATDEGEGSLHITSQVLGPFQD